MAYPLRDKHKATTVENITATPRKARRVPVPGFVFGANKKAPAYYKQMLLAKEQYNGV
jgi:hypothetical protein